MKCFYIIIINFFILSLCFLEDSEYIIDIYSSENLEEEINNNEKKTGMVLIYSTWCHHCKSFSKTYIKLSETYHNQLFFYAMSEDTDYSKKFPDISGYPSIFFYKNGTFIKNEGNRSFETLSKIICDNYLISCSEIKFSEIKNIYVEYSQKEISRNLLIGFFKDKDNINIYDSTSSKYLMNYIDFCYYCKNYKNNKEINFINIEAKENMIISFNKQKGNSSFYLDKKNSETKNKFISYLHNYVINSYEDINRDNKLYSIKSIKNTLFYTFVYNSKDTKNIKKNYIEIFNKLYNMNKRQEKNLFNYILLDKNIKYNDKFGKMKENNLYLIDKNFKRIVEFNNTDFIKEIIKKNNMRLNKEVENSIKYIFNNNKIIYSDSSHKYYIYVFIIFLVILLLIYFLCKFSLKYIISLRILPYLEFKNKSKYMKRLKQEKIYFIQN